MPTNNAVTNESIRELMGTEGPCLTVVSKPGPSLTKTLHALRREFEGNGMDAAKLTETISTAVEALPGGPTRLEQVAIFKSPSSMKVCHVGPDVTPVAKIADRFDLRTLVAVAGAQRRFYILALSQNRTRLLACTQDHSEEVAFPRGVAVNFVEERNVRQPDHTLNNMSAGGPSTGSMKGVMSGTATEREDKDLYLAQFFKEVDHGVNAILRDSSDPLVVVGVERELAIYARANTYKKTVGPGVHGAPDGLEGGEMHKRALELLAGNIHDPVVEHLREFDKKVGTGHGSAHIQDVVAAAYEGRVAHLYFQSNAKYSGSYDAVRRVVKHSDTPVDGATDLIERAAEQTLLHGGDVRLLNAADMPNGVSMCAIFRYPAAQSSGAVTGAEA